MTLSIGRVLGGFNHRVARRLIGRQPWRGQNGVWLYPPLEDVIVEELLQEVGTYLYHLHNTVAQFIATRPIMDLCLAAERRTGSRVDKQWWEQDGMDLEGMHTEDQEEKRKEREGETE